MDLVNQPEKFHSVFLKHAATLCAFNKKTQSICSYKFRRPSKNTLSNCFTYNFKYRSDVDVGEPGADPKGGGGAGGAHPPVVEPNYLKSPLNCPKYA